jgi:spore coat protein A, manganese oxidase
MSTVKRRQLLKYGLVTTGGLWVLRRGGLARAIPDASSDFSRAPKTIPGASIPKYTWPLLIPPVMPQSNKHLGPGAAVDYYEIAARQFTQNLLPPELGLAPTTVWGYGSINHPETFSSPSFTIEATWQRPVLVKWINDLKDPKTGHFHPHLFRIDPFLHWAQPQGGNKYRDTDCYLLCGELFNLLFERRPPMSPVPIVTHLHGVMGAGQESDGFAEAWVLPAANNIPKDFATTGTFYDYFKLKSPLGHLWEPGASVYQYLNDQRAGTLWYHDHTLGITRLNVYAGLAGYYLIRGGPDDLPPGVLPGPAPRPGDCPGTRVYEIPLVIQDRTFNEDGSLYYPPKSPDCPPGDTCPPPLPYHRTRRPRHDATYPRRGHPRGPPETEKTLTHASGGPTRRTPRTGITAELAAHGARPRRRARRKSAPRSFAPPAKHDGRIRHGFNSSRRP